jgi:hypothetical protein
MRPLLLMKGSITTLENLKERISTSNWTGLSKLDWNIYILYSKQDHRYKSSLSFLRSRKIPEDLLAFLEERQKSFPDLRTKKSRKVAEPLPYILIDANKVEALCPRCKNITNHVAASHKVKQKLLYTKVVCSLCNEDNHIEGELPIT